MFYRNLLILLLLLLFSTCQPDSSRIGWNRRFQSESTDTPMQTESHRAIYHWKTTYNPNEQERHFLCKHRIEKLYIRYFDLSIDREGSSRQVIPSAVTTFCQPVPEGMEIVPTVYVTLDALKVIAGNSGNNHNPNIRTYAQKTLSYIDAMSAANNISNIREIQIDCDWTNSTEKAFHNFCSILKKSLHDSGRRLSLTIRLHQLRKTAPPADYGVLMLYNTGGIRNYNTDNSILDPKDIRGYFNQTNNRIANYALPLDIAYPTFEWCVLFNKEQYCEGILYNIDLRDKAHFRRNNSRNNLYKVLQSYTYGATELFPGDELRHEFVAYETLSTCKQLAEQDFLKAKRNYSVILYHLDHTNLSKYTPYEIEALYSH